MTARWRPVTSVLLVHTYSIIISYRALSILFFSFFLTDFSRGRSSFVGIILISIWLPTAGCRLAAADANLSYSRARASNVSPRQRVRLYCSWRGVAWRGEARRDTQQYLSGRGGLEPRPELTQQPAASSCPDGGCNKMDRWP